MKAAEVLQSLRRMEREDKPVLSPAAEQFRKEGAFRAYVRARRLVEHNKQLRHERFVTLHRRKAELLAEEYPDFPAAYEGMKRRW